MNVNLKALDGALKQLHDTHAATPGSSGRSADWENGFLHALEYVRKYVVPAFETMEKEEAAAIEESMQNEIEDLKAKQQFGL